MDCRMEKNRFDRITHDPNFMKGKACIRETRISVGMIIGLVETGFSIEEILALHPSLEEEDIRQAEAYAERMVVKSEAPSRRK